ncbi:WbqC family protein [Rhizobium binae]|uniref:WbqC family protein n=1 Tax=Rhizobium binae TaxID=1138190 RepID=UPI001C82FD78|nr:WbqC family protein [Rhizobium binae]MBX4925969.1 WbqC family protein [Rhizobium binae]MBX4938665.1 WbqC family protein [Rhizobium binae]MBX4943835.1 WbqC family protein [Rhizobium binae]MBX4979006.1 WbqC family protein [Rhizobium binae]
MKRVAIIQSSYIPWRGFFDLISRCDEYIIYDQVAYSKGHWHNRNKIKTETGTRWITIPVMTSDRLGQPIEDVEIKGDWAQAHFAQVRQAYKKAPAATDFLPVIESLYKQAEKLQLLTEVNELFLRHIVDTLKLKIVITRDRIYSPRGARSERVLATCLAAGATHYLSGPSAKVYLDEAMFRDAGVTVEWMSYGPYPEYTQLHGAFDGQVSVIDSILNGNGAGLAALPAQPQGAAGC